MTRQAQNVIDPSQTIQSQRTQEIDISRLIGYVLSNIWLIISVTLLFSLGGYIHGKLSVPIFSADALVQVERKSSGISALGGMADLLTPESQSTTEVEIIKSRMVIGTVVDQLDLTTQVVPEYSPVIGNFLARRSGAKDRVLISEYQVPPEFVARPLTLLFEGKNFSLMNEEKVLLRGVVGEPISLGEWKLNITDVETNNTHRFRLIKNSRQRMILSYQGRLKVSERGRMTGIIAVSIESPDRENARKVLDGVVNEYLLQNIRRTAAEAEKSLEFLNEQIPTIHKNLAQAEEQLNQYRLESRSVDLNLETSGLLNMVIDVEKRLNELNIKETELSRLYTSQHPSYQALVNQKQRLTKEQVRLTEQIKNLPETQQQVLRLTRDVHVNQEIYLQLVNRTQELNIVKAGTVGNVRIIDKAEINLTPVAPNKAKTLLLSFILGLLVSSGWIWLRVVLRRGIESVEQLEEEGISVCASVPLSELQGKLLIKSKKQAKRSKTHTRHLPLLAVEHPDDLSVEAVRSLRTYLHFAMAEAKNNVVMLSGSSPEVGKSFVSANLAVTLAQSGLRILLIDADLRRGTLNLYFNTEKKYGLSGLLSNPSFDLANYASAIHSTSIAGLDFIPCGKSTSYPSELLMSTGFRELIEKASADYDCVLIDTPPILAVTDPSIVGRHAGTIMLVARFEKTQVKELVYAIQRFDKNGLVINGVILNGVERRRADQYYGYHYQYGYSYKSKETNQSS